MNTSDESETIKRILERLEQLEKRMEMLENIQSSIGNSNETIRSMEQRAEGINKDSPSITIELVKKNYHEANYDEGDSGDRIDFIFRFTNHFPKDIRAFTGVVILRDLFDRDILRIKLTNEETVQSQKSVDWKGGIEYNQFMSEHQRLFSIAQNDLSVGFVLQHIIYTDGSKQSFDLV